MWTRKRIIDYKEGFLKKRELSWTSAFFLDKKKLCKLETEGKLFNLIEVMATEPTPFIILSGEC